MCGSSSLLLIRSNQISTETVTGVSSVCNPGGPSETSINCFCKSGASSCRVPCCISCTPGVDQSLLPSFSALLLTGWDHGWTGLCSQPAQALAAGAEDRGNKLTPRNPVFMLNTQPCATLSFCGGAVSHLARPKDKCCRTTRLTQPPSEPGEEHQGRWSFPLSKDAWQPMAWAELVRSPVAAQGARPHAVMPCSQEVAPAFTAEQLMGLKQSSWKCTTCFGDAGCYICWPEARNEVRSILCLPGYNLQDILPEPRTFSPVLFPTYLLSEQMGGAHLPAPHSADGIFSQLGIMLQPDDSSETHRLHVCRKNNFSPPFFSSKLVQPGAGKTKHSFATQLPCGLCL